jgi:hypothetical protein
MERDAVIVADPAEKGVARPWNPGILLMFATLVLDELQVTNVVKSRTLLSEKCPLAVNCCPVIFVVMEIMAVAGIISIDSSTAGVTVSVVEPEKSPELAVIVVEPAATDVTSPLEPDVLLMVATLVFEVFQVTNEEIFWVVSSDSFAIATNSWVVPSAMLGFSGVTVIEVMTSRVTVSIAGGLVTLGNDATMVAVP